MLTRQDLGRRHECGLPTGLDNGGGGEQGNDGLAGADIAMEEPQHALRLRQVGDDVGDRALLRGGERIGQRRNYARARAAFRCTAAPRANAQVGPQQRQRELACQQFVISEPRPRRAFRRDILRRLRSMDTARARRQSWERRCV